MHSPSPRSEPQLQRHRLVRVAPAAWDALLASRADLADVPLLRDWARKGWPLIVRRPLRDDAPGIPLGVPLPPSAGKQRIAVTLAHGQLQSEASLPSPSDVLASAPESWRPTLRALSTLADAFGVRAGVFGSLAWQSLTGLDYLGPHSDLDVAWTLPTTDALDDFLEALAVIDARAPMRIDGELLRDDGAGVNWRELHGAGDALAVKTTTNVTLCTRNAFLAVPA